MPGKYPDNIEDIVGFLALRSAKPLPAGIVAMSSRTTVAEMDAQHELDALIEHRDSLSVETD